MNSDDRHTKITREFVAERQKELEASIARTFTRVALLGAGGKGLEERRDISDELAERGIAAIIPEDDFTRDVPISHVESLVFSLDEVDLIFVNIQSWGSAAEFTELRNNSKVAPKLRVFVARKYHPLYGSSSSYLTDAYLTHDAVFGHVYVSKSGAAEEVGESWIPTARELVVKISQRFRQWKALSSK